jgi:hypothetical protein
VILVDGLFNGRLDDACMGRVSQVLEHVHGSAQHGHRVGNVLSGNGRASVPGARLENSVLQPHKIKFGINLKFLESLRDRRSFCQR